MITAIHNARVIRLNMSSTQETVSATTNTRWVRAPVSATRTLPVPVSAAALAVKMAERASSEPMESQE